MKHFNRLKKYGVRLGCIAASGALPVVAMATPAGPYDAITDAVDFAAVATAVGVIGGLLAIALVAKKGVRMVLGMIGR